MAPQYQIDRRPFHYAYIPCSLVLFRRFLDWRANRIGTLGWIQALSSLAGVYVVTLFTNPPLHSVHHFLTTQHNNGNSKETRSKKEPVIVCMGDSITQGKVSGDWVSQIQEGVASKCHVVNNGQNNIVTYTTALERVDWTLACNPDYVIVILGSNDVRCPIDPLWHWAVRAMWRIPQAVTMEHMESNYRDILNQLLERNSTVKVAVCTIPPIGENLETRWNEQVRKYNAMLESIVASFASTKRVQLLDVYAALTRRIQKHQEVAMRQPSSAEMIPFHAVWQTFGKYLLGLTWDRMSSWAGNTVLSDGIHLSNRGALILRDVVVSWLGEQMEKVN